MYVHGHTHTQHLKYYHYSHSSVSVKFKQVICHGGGKVQPLTRNLTCSDLELIIKTSGIFFLLQNIRIGESKKWGT